MVKKFKRVCERVSDLGYYCKLNFTERWLTIVLFKDSNCVSIADVDYDGNLVFISDNEYIHIVNYIISKL